MTDRATTLATLAGHWICPADGDYYFWMSSDDNGKTYIATDDDPANITLLCREPSWGGIREWSGGRDRGGPPPVNQGGPITLTAGQRVYLEGRFSEGGGGDNYALAAVGVPVGDPAPAIPANGSAPISIDEFAAGDRFSPAGTIFQHLCDVVITKQPACSGDITIGKRVTFTVGVDGTPEYSYQWSLNGVDIPGATGKSYTTPPTMEDSGSDVYRVRVKNFFSSALSDGVSPCLKNEVVVLKCFSHCGIDEVHVVFNKNVKLNGTYTVADSGGIPVAVNAVRYGSSHREVILETDFLLAEETFTLTVSGVTDVLMPAHGLLDDPTVCLFHNGANTFRFNFAEDGVLPAGTATSGSAGGAGFGTGAMLIESGHMQITKLGVGGQNNFWTSPFGATYPIDHYTASWKQYLEGAGQADGMSFNLGVGPDNDGTAPFSYRFGAAEEGATTGLNVTVDTFDNGGAESGVEINYNGSRLAFVRAGGGGNGPPELMKAIFVDASMSLSPDGHVKFQYDNFTVEADIPDFTSLMVNRAEFAGRTGGASENLWIDDVVLNGSSPERLTITRDPGTGKVTVSWTVDGCRLECTGELNSDPTLTVWTDVSHASPYVTTPTGKRFYRLVVE